MNWSDLTLAQSLFSLELDQNSVEFIADWLTSFENNLYQLQAIKRQKQKLLPNYLSCHSIYVFNCLQQELIELNGLNLPTITLKFQIVIEKRNSQLLLNCLSEQILTV